MSAGEKQWYTKYRPKTVEEYSGEKVKSIVKRRFTSEQKRPNVMMVYGTSGCGKTTLCRMLTKYYLCESPKEDGTPCEECEMCKMINERLIYGEDGVECDGVTELDSTKANKDQMENIIEDAMVAPIFTKKKILIIDECHKLNNSTQSLLLKLMEDIPKHLVIMLATTDEDKVLEAIMNRCQVKIEVHRQSVKEMADVMLEIAKKENITVSKQALELIAKTEGRVPRQCINTLEDIAKSFDGVVNVDNVTEMCSIVRSDLYIDFYNAANTGLEDILLFNNRLKNMDLTVTKFMSGLMKFTMEAIYIKHGIALDEYTKEYVKQVKKLFSLYKSGDFDMLLQILEYAAKMLSADENRNEVLLTTTAMRISKIDMLANGISMERGNAVIENSESLAKHLESIKENAKIVEDDYKVDMSAEEMVDEYKDMETVDDGGIAKSLIDMALSEMGSTEEDADEEADNGEDLTYDQIEQMFGN